MGIEKGPQVQRIHTLQELLEVEVLPDFEMGDIIPFEKGTVDELRDAALVLIDSFASGFKPVLHTDESGLKKRIQHDKITGLKLKHLEIVDFSEFELSVNNTMRQMLGFETRVTGSMRYPGYGEVQLDFPFVVLESEKFFRFGPYDVNKRIIGPVKNEEIQRALAVSRHLGAFATSGKASRVSRRGNALIETTT